MSINYCIYSIQRSGRHIVEEFLQEHLKYKFCNCCIDDETITKECYKTLIHLKHEGGNKFDFKRIKRCIFLYRKDIVEQLDAVLRILYTEVINKKSLATKKEHTTCTIDSNLTYDEIISVIKTTHKGFKISAVVDGFRKFYKDMDENRNSNTLFVDFDSLVYTPATQLRKIAEFTGDTTETIIKKAINDYLPIIKNYTKKKMSYKRYVDLMKIIHESEYKHGTNLLIVSFPRSGFHLLQTIFESYFSIKECGCQKNCDVNISTFVKEDIAFHRSHDMKLDLNKEQFNKTIILYRKDMIESLDAFFRYQFRTFDNLITLNNDLIKHSSCHELDISYSEKKDFFRNVSREYKDWVQKWVTEPSPNSIIIEYSDFMRNPQDALDRVQEHLFERKDSELSAKIVEEMKIEYKHSITPEKYQELADLLATLS